MARALVIIANPHPGSFSHAMASRASRTLGLYGYDVDTHDLYGEGFQPVLHPNEATTVGEEAESALTSGADRLVSEHRRQLAGADVLVVTHPNWWGKPPAMMAGWIDRVLVPGVVYRLSRGEGEPECLLSLRRLAVLNTSDTPAEREEAVFGDPLGAIWRRCVGAYLGNAEVARFVAGPMASSTPAQRQAWLDQVEDVAMPPT